MSRSRSSFEKAPAVIVGSVIRHWTRAIASEPRDVIVLSPYVTSSTAETVLTKAGAQPVRVYTVFEAYLFASGASQIETLRRLAESGHRVFHLPGLHAKVVLTKSTATVGSQNLTRGGEANREATVIMHDRKTVGDLRREVAKWLSSARPIPIERIRDMEQSLPAIRKAFRAFKDRADRLDKSVAETARKRRTHPVRDKIARALEEPSSEESERLERLRMHLAESKCALRPVRVRIRRWPYETLVCREAASDLTSWPMSDGTRVKLTPRWRYLLVSPTGRLAWPALNKTCLTQFGGDLLDDAFEFNGKNVRLSFSAVPSPRDGDVNVKLELRVNALDPPVVLRAWFDLAGLELRDTGPPAFNEGTGAEWIARQIQGRRNELTAALSQRLLVPFRYRTNRHGIKATEFLGTARRDFTIMMRRRGGLEFFALE
jgi:hypothetical protein